MKSQAPPPPPKPTEKTPLMLLDDLYKKPGHFKVFQWPTEELKKIGIAYQLKFPSHRYIIRAPAPAIPAADGKVRIELCELKRVTPNRKLDPVSGVVIEHIFTMSNAVFDGLKRLVSLEYKEQLEKDHMARTVEKRNLFMKTYMNDAEFKSFIRSLTRDFFTELFKEHIDVLNLEVLATSSYNSYQESAYWFFTNLIEKGDQKNQETKEIKALQYRMFYDHYPAFNNFADSVADICGGDYPDIDEFNESELQELNFKYNSRLFNFVCESVSRAKPPAKR